MKVVTNRARTLMLSAANPKRFCASTSSGVSLIQVTVASATRSTGFCFTVRIPLTFADTVLPGLEGPGDLDALHVEGDPAVGLDFGVEIALAAHVGVALVDAGLDQVHVDLDRPGGRRRLRRIEGQGPMFDFHVHCSRSHPEAKARASRPNATQAKFGRP